MKITEKILLPVEVLIHFKVINNMKGLHSKAVRTFYCAKQSLEFESFHV